MPNVQIGKYTRPGIYVEEFNDSAIETPIVTGLQTLVIGSSKKGPINSPTLINSQTELERIFGDLDTTLEANYSYFHRTISKVLESSPVIAMNIVDIDNDLDQLEYQSLSTSTGYVNDIKREAGYSRFFDTASFWKKDREAFLSVTANNVGDTDRILHFTNLNDRQVTMFIVKAQNPQGFNRTLRDWYGGSDKVPLYLDPLDYASDYLVDVIILPGDWTNYNQLAVDNEWGQFFSPQGLVKSELFNLANNVNANALAVFRNLSLVPYFTDSSGNNIFIEDRINRRTNETGIYCAYDLDAVETSFRNGLLDLVGNRLINSEIDSIEMLSYNDSIIETLDYPQTPLDSTGNVHQLTFDNYYQDVSKDRTAFNAEGYAHNITGPSASSATHSGTASGGSPQVLEFTSTSGYTVIGGEKLNVDSASFSYSPDDLTATGASQSVVFYINSDGNIQTNPSNAELQTNVVLGVFEYVVDSVSASNYFSSVDYTPISIDENGFIYYDNTGTDITITVNANESQIIYEFEGTIELPDITDYKNYRLWKTFNEMSSILTSGNSNRAVILTEENGDIHKKSISDLTVSVNNSTSTNKSITIGGFETGELDGSNVLRVNGLVLHEIDNEFIIGSKGANTTNEVAGATYGIVAQYSDIYEDYTNGIINTGDYFYENLIVSLNPTYFRFLDINGTDYLISDVDLGSLDQIKVPESTLNTDVLLVNNTDYNNPLTSGLTGVTGSYYGYVLSTNVEEETVTNPTKLWDVAPSGDGKHNVTMYKEGDIMRIRYHQTGNNSLDITSQNSNFKQSIEAEFPTGYESVPNKILVNADRYPELRIGNFLEAEVGATTSNDEVPRKVTRVIAKKQYAGDPNLVEVTCDSAIKLYDFNGDKQTFRFTSIDDYVSTYKGINLFGFRIRPESLPGGSNQIVRENRLQDILNTIGKGTPLYNALTDKDIIDFRYIVDSYGMGLVENSKQQLADISGKRLDCFTFLNMPSMKDFRNAGTTFLDENGRLSIDYVAQGGNPEAISQFSFSVAQGDAATTVGYFTPYVTITDNGRPKNVPPAAYVATTYLRKHNSSLTSVVPWTTAAGITNGQVTGIAGLEFSFTGEDISALNGASLNPLVSKKNRGRVIETENTAETLANSALGQIHVREVLIEIEREIADMLLNFQWKFNTPEVRAEIKLRADAICEDYVTRNGLYNFFNKIDSENNTQEIIDNNMGVIDTYLEPSRSMGIIVNNVTILRTGAIQSSGFSPA